MELLNEFQERIGYEFKDESLLKQALTHSSYANEKHMKKHSDNERLEFLGDAVLELVSSEFLYLNYPDLSEGRLSTFRASLVCEPTLALCSKEIDLGNNTNYLLNGELYTVQLEDEKVSDIIIKNEHKKGDKKKNTVETNIILFNIVLKSTYFLTQL